jgi:hypothetical protein
MDDSEDDGYERIMSSTSSQSCTTWAIPQANLIEPRETPTKEQANSRIDALYQSGIPFFTKHAIKEISDQLKTQVTAGDKIITKDLTGASLEWKVKIGESLWLGTTADPEARNEFVQYDIHVVLG